MLERRVQFWALFFLVLPSAASLSTSAPFLAEMLLTVAVCASLGFRSGAVPPRRCPSDGRSMRGDASAPCSESHRGRGNLRRHRPLVLCTRVENALCLHGGCQNARAGEDFVGGGRRIIWVTRRFRRVVAGTRCLEQSSLERSKLANEVYAEALCKRLVYLPEACQYSYGRLDQFGHGAEHEETLSAPPLTEYSARSSRCCAKRYPRNVFGESDRLTLMMRKNHAKALYHATLDDLRGRWDARGDGTETGRS